MQIQQGALDFINLMKDGYGSEEINYTTAYAKLRKVTKSPSIREARLCGELHFTRSGRRERLASPRSIMHYILHPRDFKNDLTSCGWVIGFMKRLVKLSLPYDKILSILRKGL